MESTHLFSSMPTPELIFSSSIAGMQLSSCVRVAKPKYNSGHLSIRWYPVSALWDTGAVISGISRRIADILKLDARERTILSTGAGMVPAFKDTVLLDLLIDDCVIPVKVAIVDSIPGDGHDFLIGMDVIQCGEFLLSTDHSKGAFNVRFRPYPGLFKPIEEIFLQ